MESQVERAPRRFLVYSKMFFRLAVLALVGWAVWRMVERARGDFQEQGFAWNEIAGGWLAAAAGFYLIGLLPFWLFWHRALLAMGQSPSARRSGSRGRSPVSWLAAHWSPDARQGRPNRDKPQ